MSHGFAFHLNQILYQMNRILVSTLIILLSCTQTPQFEPKVGLLDSGTESLLQAISFVDNQVVWISGQQATFCRTTDAGETWQVYRHPSDTLQFRDIHAFDANQIVLMSAGLGASSRIMLFDSQSGEYTETYIMPFEQGFLNTIEFWDNQTGLAFGDSFENGFFILKTTDGGKTWIRIDPDKLPVAGSGEGGFAASGTCISLIPGGGAFIGTGAGGHSRILVSGDYGESWQSRPSPMITGDMAGIFSIRMIDENNGLIVGGDLAQMKAYIENIYFTSDQWLTSSKAKSPITKGPLFGSDFIEIHDRKLAIVCGPAGVDYSSNLEEEWIRLDSGNYWSVKMHPSGYGFAVGTKGKILKIGIN